MESNLDLSRKQLNLVMPVVQAMVNMQFNTVGSAIPGLFGDAGIGKTANIIKMCKECNWNLLDIHYGLKPLEEISGLPDFGEVTEVNGIKIKRTNWTLPDILGDVYDLSKNGLPTVIFLDDFHTASPGNMALGYEMFTAKKLRGYSFPSNSGFILAANISGNKSLANPIPAPIMNRIARFEVTVSFEHWKTEYAIPNKVNSKILAFLSNPKYTGYFQTEEIVNKPWASARSWTNFSILLNAIEQYNPTLLDSVEVYYLANAFVDDESALEFSKYYALFGDINVKDIFDRVIKFELPDDVQKRYVMSLACVDEFISRYNALKDKDDLATRAAIIYIMAEILLTIGQTNSEIAVVALKELIVIQNVLKLKGIYKAIEKQMLTLNSNVASSILMDISELV